MTNAIAYYRVSTQKQGQSGLGLAAQQTAVVSYASSNRLTLVNSFTEIETGTNKRTRPTLQQAMKAAIDNDAVLLIAKLDRLARNVHFVSGLLQDKSLKFTAVDMPNVNNMTIHILAAVAENEAQLISQRTKAALDEKRRRDGEWRVSNLDALARERSAETRKAAALAAGQAAAYPAKLLRQQGKSLAAIASELNDNGYTTRDGKKFYAMSVKRLLDM